MIEMNVPLDLDSIIRFMERTKDDRWTTKICKTKDGKQNCVMAHIFDMGGNFFWEMFESMYATTYMVYPVNDGDNPNYPQETPKERVIAYLKDLRDGKAKTTQQLDEDYDNERRTEKLSELEGKSHIIFPPSNPLP